MHIVLFAYALFEIYIPASSNFGAQVKQKGSVYVKTLDQHSEAINKFIIIHVFTFITSNNQQPTKIQGEIGGNWKIKMTKHTFRMA